MRIKAATITTTIISLIGIILSSWMLWSGNEGGPAGQGAFILSLSMLPTLVFTSFLFPTIAILIKRDFTTERWIEINLIAVLVLSLPLSIFFNSIAGSGLLFTFTFISVLITMSLLLPGLIWIRIATKRPNQRLEPTVKTPVD